MGLVSIERSLTDEVKGLKGKWISRKIDLSYWVMCRLLDSLIQKGVDSCSFSIDWPWPVSNLSSCVLGQNCEQSKILKHSSKQAIFWVCLSLLSLRKASQMQGVINRIINSNLCPKISGEKKNKLSKPLELLTDISSKHMLQSFEISHLSNFYRVVLSKIPHAWSHLILGFNILNFQKLKIEPYISMMQWIHQVISIMR